MGLTNVIAASGEGITAAHQLIEHITRGAPGAIRTMKTLLSTERDRRIAESDELEAELFRQVWASPDHREAIAAFFEKRHPRFPDDP